MLAVWPLMCPIFYYAKTRNHPADHNDQKCSEDGNGDLGPIGKKEYSGKIEGKQHTTLKMHMIRLSTLRLLLKFKRSLNEGQRNTDMLLKQETDILSRVFWCAATAVRAIDAR
mgnify:CR=1 FL=1